MRTPVHNYWTPLASQVEELDTPPPTSNHLLSIQHTPPNRRVTFTLSPHHVDKDSTLWRRGRPPDERTTYRINPLMAQHNMRMGVLNGTIPSAVSDTGATSHAFLKEDPSIPTGRVSSAIFHLPNGAVAPASTINSHKPQHGHSHPRSSIWTGQPQHHVHRRNKPYLPRTRGTPNGQESPPGVPPQRI